MFDMEHLQAIQEELSKVERTKESGALLDVMQDRE
jgi:hypothetical protein